MQQVLAVADEQGQVSLLRYPACSRQAKRKRYAGHAPAGAAGARVRFSADGCFLLTLSGADGLVFQWALLGEDPEPLAHR